MAEVKCQIFMPIVLVIVPDPPKLTPSSQKGAKGAERDRRKSDEPGLFMMSGMAESFLFSESLLHDVPAFCRLSPNNREVELLGFELVVVKSQLSPASGG